MAFGSDPFKRRARDLDKEDKALSAHLDALREEIDRMKVPPPKQPPVWRAPATPSDARRIERESVRRTERVHGAQRRRDRTRFIVFAVALLAILAWLVKHL